MKIHAMLASGTALVALAGCSFSGYDASSSFACKAPEGVLCSSMSGIYANAMARNLPEQRVHSGSGATTNIALGSYAAGPDSASSASIAAVGMNARPSRGATGLLPRALDSGAPVHTAPREMRIWFAPWQDADSDLHDQEYVYLVIDSGHWSIAHNQERIQAAFRPVMPPTPAPDAPGNRGKTPTTAANPDPSPAPMSNADRVMQGILTPAGAIDRAAAMPLGADR
ncbi:type IV conjugative transfer system lipoprotein TraV [Paraburkholderia sp. Se-20369]|nr:type IV conjugative transfer system lipoprotein TraV [Paraburkholderia sp. Se-20369]